MKLTRPLFLAFVCMVPLLAAAQWQWIDKDGRKVFSDRAPPADVPAKNILKQPAAAAPAAAAAAPAQAETAAAPATATATPKPAANAPKLSGKDKELEDKKKAAEAAEAEKKKAEAEKVAKAKAENCARAKKAKATFDSGARIATTNAKGEREIMDDAARAVETKRLEGIIATECGPAL
ncbi:MAG: DUF4124 domain-containing protein [Ramlibacter sp.]